MRKPATNSPDWRTITALVPSAVAGAVTTPLPLQGKSASDPPREKCPLHLLYGVGDLDPAWARLRAVEGGPAAPDPLAVVQDLQPLLAHCIAAVEDEAVRGDDGRRADVLLGGPV